MDDLFEYSARKASEMKQPLAERMRPQCLADLVGQDAAQAGEGPHDLDVNLHRAFAAQDARQADWRLRLWQRRAHLPHRRNPHRTA